MTELKPCPFCGNEPYIVGVDRYYALCPHCSTASRLYSTKQEAIEAWNTRFEPTCKVDYSFTNGFDELETVMECGHTIMGELDTYCSGCGRRVIEE